MHELGLADAALQLAFDEARKANASRVARIVIRVGALSGVDPEALRFALEVLAKGTSADGAAMEIEPVEAIAHCNQCQREFPAELASLFECPQCGRSSCDLKEGRELHLVRLELI